MQIGFDAKRLFLNHSGLGNYSRNLLHALVKYFPNNQYHLFTPNTSSNYPDLLVEPYKIVTPNNLVDSVFKSHWRSNSITKQVNQQNLDVFHGLSNELPFTISDFKGKKVVTIHDLIFIRYPDFYKSFDRSRYRKKVISACQMADSIIAISQQTKNDLIEFLKIDESKITIVYQSCDDVFWNYKLTADETISSQNNLPSQFVLYVGTVEPRKNLLKLVEAMKLVDAPLVVVGRIKSNYGKQILEFIAKNNLRQKIIFLENVTNQKLAWLYSKAICLVYPSRFEGFGLPILEAMVCECPVITGNNSSLVEVGGQAAMYINVDKTDEYVDSLNKLLLSNKLRNDLVLSAMAHSRQFSIESWATKTIDNYKNIRAT